MHDYVCASFHSLEVLHLIDAAATNFAATWDVLMQTAALTDRQSLLTGAQGHCHSPTFTSAKTVMSEHSTDATHSQSQDIRSHTVNGSHSNEEAPFSINDLQSQMSYIPGPSHMQQPESSHDNKALKASSGIDADAPRPSVQGSSQLKAPPTAAALEPDAGHDLSQLTEGGNGHDLGTHSAAADQSQAWHNQKASVQTHQSRNANSSTGIEDHPAAAPRAASTTSADSSASEHQSQPQHAMPAASDFPIRAPAASGSGLEEPAAHPGDGSTHSGTSASLLGNQEQPHEEDWSADTGIVEPQLAAADTDRDAVTAQSIFHVAGATSSANQSLKLPAHLSQQQEDSNWAQDVFPDDAPDAVASAPHNSIAAAHEMASGRPSPQAQGASQGNDGTDEDHTDTDQLGARSVVDAASTTGDGSLSLSQDETGLRTEVQAADSDWADGAFAEGSPPVQADAQIDCSTSQEGDLAMPQQASDGDWADNAFAVAPPAVEAEQPASLPPSAEADAAALTQGQPNASIQEHADSDGWASKGFSAEPLPAQTQEPAAASPSTAAVAEADMAADSSSASGQSAAPHKQQADEEDWGDDDFGDFNDAANEPDDNGFGAFNEADAMAGKVEEVAQSSEVQPQTPQMPTARSGKLLVPNHSGMCKTSSLGWAGTLSKACVHMLSCLLYAGSMLS